MYEYEYVSNGYIVLRLTAQWATRAYGSNCNDWLLEASLPSFSLLSLFESFRLLHMLNEANTTGYILDITPLDKWIAQ